MISLYHGSLLDVKADAIVNPANGSLAHGGGVARLIAEAATHVPVFGMMVAESGSFSDARNAYEFLRARADAWDNEQYNHPLIATGAAGWTSSGALPYQGIIHAVGPIWGGGDCMERELLELAHENAFNLAVNLGYSSVVVPAISCGIYGFPVEEAAPIAIEVAGWYSGTLDITFALFEAPHFAAYETALSVIGQGS